MRGGGDDAKHPSSIHMDMPSPSQAPRGPVTRARARNIDNEVTSFLFESRSESHMNRVLPQTEMLCFLRYLGGHHEEHGGKHQVHPETQAPMVEEEEEARREKREGGVALDTPGARARWLRRPGPSLARLQPAPGARPAAPGARPHLASRGPGHPRVPGLEAPGARPATRPQAADPGARTFGPGCPASSPWTPAAPPGARAVNPRVPGHLLPPPGWRP